MGLPAGEGGQEKTKTEEVQNGPHPTVLENCGKQHSQKCALGTISFLEQLSAVCTRHAMKGAQWFCSIRLAALLARGVQSFPPELVVVLHLL